MALQKYADVPNQKNPGNSKRVIKEIIMVCIQEFIPACIVAHALELSRQCIPSSTSIPSPSTHQTIQHHIPEDGNLGTAVRTSDLTRHFIFISL
jgi:hypothetical protein